MMVGSYYCFDIPAALKTQIDDYLGNSSDYEVNFSLLYTLYSAPNVNYRNSIVDEYLSIKRFFEGYTPLFWGIFGR